MKTKILKVPSIKQTVAKRKKLRDWTEKFAKEKNIKEI